MNWLMRGAAGLITLCRRWLAGYVFLLTARLGRARNVGRMSIVDLSPLEESQPFWGSLRYALQIIQDVDPRWFTVFNRYATCVIVADTAPDRLFPGHGVAVLSQRTVQCLSPEFLACFLVHYVARARIQRACGITRHPGDVDCAARRAELRFARRVPQSNVARDLARALHDSGCSERARGRQV